MPGSEICNSSAAFAYMQGVDGKTDFKLSEASKSIELFLLKLLQTESLHCSL